jgi:hypothetical protein
MPTALTDAGATKGMALTAMEDLHELDSAQVAGNKVIAIAEADDVGTVCAVLFNGIEGFGHITG